jgi:murein L,D-transpeptidase YafK
LRFTWLVPALILIAPARVAAAQPCTGKGTSVVVLTREQKLFVCVAGQEKAGYRVSIGKAGTGKRKKDDNKTPLGTYPLGSPRSSSRFGTFIPVGYPTAEQRSRGLSGGDIGIHGPPRAFAWAGFLTTLVDWTRGCIAVGSDSAIKEIATAVTAAGIRVIHID